MSSPANSFEGKLHAFRRTQDGVVISYVVHPNDVSAAMATAALGTRYMIGFAEIGDDDKPVSQTALEKQIAPAFEKANAMLDAVVGRRPFASLPLSQQAAIRCGDEAFGKFMEGMIYGTGIDTPADAVRHWCRVDSRSKIIAGTPVGDSWTELEAKYQAWLATQRYASVAR